MEGTGSFAAGLVAVLTAAGEDVVEITGTKPPGARRTTGSTPCRRRAVRWPASSRPHPVPAAYGRRCARS